MERNSGLRGDVEVRYLYRYDDVFCVNFSDRITKQGVNMISDKSLDEIKAVLKKYEKELKKRFGVKEIGIFGSYVRDEDKKSSDIDILIEFYPKAEMDLIKFVELEEYLSDLLGTKVDLVMKSALKPRIGKRILKEVVYL